MSMLAERKIKQKWSLNPRGKAWSEDSSKFGQKILEKMGWSHGKGLGTRENGIVEHVKIPYKNDAKGVGYKETNDQWTEHDSQFNALLQSLSGQTEVKDEIKLSSLEAKSQKSKVRVHYKKFTRGKDLSRCSEKDLASIFGKRSLQEPNKIEEVQGEAKRDNEDSFTYNGGSMVDYFKKKIPNFGKSNGYVVGSNGVLKKDTDSEEESRGGFGFGFSNPAFDPLHTKVEVQRHVLNSIEEEIGETLKDEDDNNVSQYTGDSYNGEDQDTYTKKKKKKKSKRETDSLSIDNPSYENLETDSTLNNEKDENQDVCSKKKKRKKETTSLAMDNPSYEDADLQHSNEDIEIKKKKKKRRNEGLSNPAFDLCNTTEDSNSSEHNNNEEVHIKKKKRKKGETTELGLSNPVFDVYNENSEDQQQILEKKKRKRNREENSESLSNGMEVKRKKNEESSIDNPNFDENSQNSYFNETFEVKRKKKKRKDSLGTDNPNFNDKEDEKSIEEPEMDLILNVTSTPTVINSTPVVSSSKQSSIRRRKSVRFSDVTEERIIPNNDDMARSELFDINSKVIENGLRDEIGTTNLGFNSQQIQLEESIDEMSRKIDGFQAEIENDINEAKVSECIGEVGNPDGENEKLPEGTRLKFKYARFGKQPFWVNKNPSSKAKCSYKHLIKGDIILGFKNTNLHTIKGYGVKNNR